METNIGEPAAWKGSFHYGRGPGNGRSGGTHLRARKGKTLPLSVLEAHARRGDFSQWIADVFRDHVLASDVRKVEQRYRLGHTRDLYNALAESIQARYELFPEIDDVGERSATVARA